MSVDRDGDVGGEAHAPIVDRLRRRLLFGALAGAVAWVVLVALDLLADQTPRSLEPVAGARIHALLALAPLVITPLGLAVAATPGRDGRHPWSYRAAAALQPFAAALAIASLRAPPSVTAALLALPWFVVTALVALFGLARLLPRGFSPREETCLDFGLLYLPIGGAWLVLCRLGNRPFAFSDAIVELTAVHFHYAGFAAPLIAGVAGRLCPPRARGAYAVAAVAVMTTPPLVAIGILTSPTIEAMAAGALALGLLTLSALIVFQIGPRLTPRIARVPLTLSALALIVTMACACTFAFGELTGHVLIDLPQMVRFHGIANALGFALCGLLGFAIAAPTSRVPAVGAPCSRLWSRGRVGADYFDRYDAHEKDGRAPRGLVDDFASFARTGFDPAAMHPEVRRFYEQTLDYRLVVHARWRRGFHLLSRLYRTIFDRVEQLCLPLEGARDDAEMTSRIVAVDARKDGRASPRAWVRAYLRTGRTMFVAVYSQHRARGETYMNIALPLPLGNVTGLLRVDATTDAAADALPGAITLRSRVRADETRGDEGIWFVRGALRVRLPLDERFTVWAERGDSSENAREGASDPPRLRARHALSLFGIECACLDYRIERDASAAEPALAAEPASARLRT